MPTAFSAKPLLGKIVMPDEPVPVWPDPEGPEHDQALLTFGHPFCAADSIMSIP